MASTEPLILLDKKKIMSLLTHKNIELDIFDSIQSTSDFLLSEPSRQKIRVCLAEQQTTGRGRLGRYWHSPFGENIYFSLKYPFGKDVSELGGLSLVVGLAVRKALENAGLSNKISLKWPNDIIYDNKKLGGNLVDVRAENNGICHAIIGIGINVNMKNDNDHITQPWTSLYQIFHTYIDRNILSAHLINHLIHYIHVFETKGFSAFIAEWESHDGLLNKRISLKCGDKEITGKAKGITANGHLLLETSPNNLSEFSSGDTTIQKQ